MCQPLISFIIPVFNSEKTISRCLNSILSQQLKENEYEVVIINDGSTDNSILKIKELELDKYNIKIYNIEHQGAGLARNYGIKYSRGKYICFIDSDDYLIKGGIRVLIDEYLNFHKGYDIYIYSSFTVDKYYKKKYDQIMPHSLSYIGYAEDFIKTYGIGWSIWNMLILREYIIKNSIYFNDFTIGEDVDFRFSLLKKNIKIISTNLNIYRYNVTCKSILNQNNKPIVLKIIYDFLLLYKKILNYKKNNYYIDKLIVVPLINIQRQIITRILSIHLKKQEFYNIIRTTEFQELISLNYNENKIILLGRVTLKNYYNYIICSNIYRHIFLPIIKPFLTRN